jgi:hypothetical protein
MIVDQQLGTNDRNHGRVTRSLRGNRHSTFPNPTGATTKILSGARKHHRKAMFKELTAVGHAILAIINADREVSTSPRVIEHLCANVEGALRDLIRKELLVHNVLVERNPH